MAVIVFATKPTINPGDLLIPYLSITITRANGAKSAEYRLPEAEWFAASSEACDVRMATT